MTNLEDDLLKLKEQLTKEYKQNDSNLIYLRLSAIDFGTENPHKDALDKLRSDFNSLLEKYSNLKEDGFKLFIEIKSAYKNSTREEFIKLYENYLFQCISIKDLLENNKDFKEKNLYVSSYDRISRVFLYSLSFQILRKIANINIYSLSQEEYDLEIKSKDIQEQDNQQQLLYIFQLMMFSSMASKHSEDMSYKIKKRIEKSSKGTISNKTGNKWGREKSISDSMRKKIKERVKRYTYKEVSEQTDIYQLVNNEKKNISPHTIRAIAKGE